MKSTIKLGIIAFGLICVSACSPVKVYTEKNDFVEQKSYRTFAILNEVKGKAAFNSPIMEERLQNHLIAGMEKRGFHYNADAPDLIIRYNTDVQQNQRVVYPSYGGWGMWNPWMWGMPMAPEVRNYDQGEVIIDFIDPHIDRVIMRATAVGTVNNPDQKQKKINTAVEKILKEFSTKLEVNA
ncbi:DUF4136 domain-containing protein [Anditalea andensis]|uniref:DUF4136 domain-containing protein n=1 Tax=Anditalea andensis TaxID=1048983 RepID=A0A074KY17_9BACT|nr:DUF4136 domain-containing protein [Anditalea andensis]KEO73844.1 hypothetical protein EL17_10095 [Anditalea andensis]